MYRFNLILMFLRQCLLSRGLVSCLVHYPRPSCSATAAAVRQQTRWNSCTKKNAVLAAIGGSRGGGDSVNTNAATKKIDQAMLGSGGVGGSDDPESTTRLISFFTDIEGDRDYLQRYVEQSKVLCWRRRTRAGSSGDDGTRSTTNDDHGDIDLPLLIDFRDPNGTDMAVFGGDIWDQGGNDLWCLDQLLDLRMRYPHRFHCILGNRDVNKMRLASELHVTDYPTSIFFKKNEVMTFPTRGDRLRHILKNTMGSPRAFEYRRQELQELHPSKAMITDDDVVDSYQDLCDPLSGRLIDYIERSALMLQFGQVAFLHGALPADQMTNNDEQWQNLTVIMPWLRPGVSAPDVGVQTIDDWIKALNDFVKTEVASFRKYGKDYAWIERGGYHGLYGGLIQYGMGMLPGRIVNPTLVYNRWGTRSVADDTAPRQFWDHGQTESMQAFFRQSGIKVICCGHQPIGEMPNTIRIDVDGEPHWIVACDTSYSGDVIVDDNGDDNNNNDNKNKNVIHRSHPGREHSKSGRGMRAVSEVLIEQYISNGRILDVHCHGVLSDGTPYSTRGLMSHEIRQKQHVSEFRVGTLSKLDAPCGGKWWTQGSFADGSFLLAASKGFDFWSRIIR